MPDEVDHLIDEMKQWSDEVLVMQLDMRQRYREFGLTGAYVNRVLDGHAAEIKRRGLYVEIRQLRLSDN
jgi:hypothetical protein